MLHLWPKTWDALPLHWHTISNFQYPRNYWLGKSLLPCEAATPVSAHCLKQLRTHATQKRAQGGLWQWERALGHYEWQCTDCHQAKRQWTERRKHRSKIQEYVALLPLKQGGKKKKYTSYIQNHLIFGKIQVCIYIYTHTYIYILVQESVHMWVSILQLVTGKEWKSLISQRWNRSQEKDFRIWGTMRYQLETTFKIQHVHFGNKM